MTGSMLQRRVLGVQRPSSLATRLHSLLVAPRTPRSRSFSSSIKSRGFTEFLRFPTIQPPDGQLTPADFRCKAALVVNTASKCSHSAQLKQLQQLHEKYRDSGLVVVAVPSNDFAGQEPGDRNEILERYAAFGVTFAIAEKTTVKGEDAHPFFKRIADKYSASVAPTWNFDKFLVDHQGDMHAVFPNDTEPLVEQVVAEIEEVLQDLPEPGQELEEEDEEDDEYDYEEGDSDSDDEDSDDEEEEKDENRRLR
ncbi:hypothetical protein PF003_g26780 [Phytophthora fragariae]|nr:hypothetical protein PF003_g30186 [Phytophthora fragariae]KAE8889357.1 hypothetical protein PF003_g26780 [Phytophthora fragariae]